MMFFDISAQAKTLAVTYRVTESAYAYLLYASSLLVFFNFQDLDQLSLECQLGSRTSGPDIQTSPAKAHEDLNSTPSEIIIY